MPDITRADIRTILRHLDTIKAFTFAMRKEVRIPRHEEVYGSDEAVDKIRDMVLALALKDVVSENAS